MHGGVGMEIQSLGRVIVSSYQLSHCFSFNLLILKVKSIETLSSPIICFPLYLCYYCVYLIVLRI